MEKEIRALADAIRGDDPRWRGKAFVIKVDESTFLSVAQGLNLDPRERYELRRGWLDACLLYSNGGEIVIAKDKPALKDLMGSIREVGRATAGHPWISCLSFHSALHALEDLEKAKSSDP